MKILIVVLVGLAAFCFGFWVDAQLINWALTQFPPSAHEWLGVIKLVLWFVTFGVTFTLSAYLGIIVGGVLATIFEVNEGVQRNKVARAKLDKMIKDSQKRL